MAVTGRRSPADIAGPTGVAGARLATPDRPRSGNACPQQMRASTRGASGSLGRRLTASCIITAGGGLVILGWFASLPDGVVRRALPIHAGRATQSAPT